MTIQCSNEEVTNKVYQLLQQLVDEYYLRLPTAFMSAVILEEKWTEVCGILEAYTDMFYVLLQAHQVGIFCDK